MERLKLDLVTRKLETKEKTNGREKEIHLGRFFQTEFFTTTLKALPQLYDPDFSSICLLRTLGCRTLECPSFN